MKKTPFVTKAQIEKIAETYPTPFHIYDEKGSVKMRRHCMRRFAWNPGYKRIFCRSR